MSQDISFLVERLQHLIPEAIIQGLVEGLKPSPRRVEYRKWERIKDEDLKPGQSAFSYGWSEDTYTGYFLEFAHYDNPDIESDVIIETPDGYIVGCTLSQCRFLNGHKV